MNTGKFEPAWKSLEQYEIPEWFRNAKFGIWAHWGPQCQPEQGDWYARNMYVEGNRQYNWHNEHYGHPSEFGFKEVINAGLPIQSRKNRGRRVHVLENGITAEIFMTKICTNQLKQ